MCKFFLAVCLLATGCLSIRAQYRVEGHVTDSLGAPVDAAVVALMSYPSGEVLRQCITAADGKFVERVKGTVQLYISCLGYKQYIGGSFTVRRDTVLPPIRLYSEQFVLDDVVVTAEKQSPSIRIERGKMVFSPRNSSIIAGTSALEMLRKTPGVFVDGENNISIGGKSGVLILLNGKQTYMQKEELVTLLKATPASSVSAVEVIQNPPSQYDAEGSGGIIDIRMDKRRTDGFSLSVNNGVSYWRNLRQNTEVSFTYANNKLNLSGNYNHTFGHYAMDYGMHRIQGGKDYYSPTADTDKRNTVSGNINLEYRINDKQLWGGRIEANTNFGPGETRTMTEIRDAKTMALEQILYASNEYYEQRGNRYGGSLYYVAEPSKETSYTVEANYAWFDGGSGNMQPNVYQSPSGNVLQDNLYRSVNGRNIHIFALSYDQKHPLFGGELRSGAKYSYVNADNDYRFYRVHSADNEEIDKDQSNRFGYKEQIAAAYLQYSRAIGEKVTFEAGLRGEYTFSDSRLRTVDGSGDENHSRRYFNLFPSVSLNWQASENHAFSLSYGSRINRPAYQDLNPFEYLLDELSSWKGNAFLTPQKNHRVSLSYSHKRTAITASYSYMKDYKAQITDTISVSKVIMTPRNIGKQQRVSLTFYQGVDVTRWWELNLNLVGYYVRNDIAFDRFREFDTAGFGGIFSVQNQFRLPFGIRMELNGSYLTKRPGESNERISPSGMVDAGLSKSFAEKRWTVSLAMSDIFWTSRWDNHSAFEGFSLWNWGKGESRQIKLNVTFRFGKQKGSTHQSSFDELERL